MSLIPYFTKGRGLSSVFWERYPLVLRREQQLGGVKGLGQGHTAGRGRWRDVNACDFTRLVIGHLQDTAAEQAG